MPNDTSPSFLCPDCGATITGTGADISRCPDHDPAPDGLSRPTKDEHLTLFDMGPAWESHWWGMPSFTMGDATPSYRVTVNFLTLEDLHEFADRLGVRLGPRSNSMWFPPQRLDEPKEWAYVTGR